MFNIKFATSKTIKANSVSEDYYTPGESAAFSYRLNINTDEDYALDHVINILNEDGALASITVSSDDEAEKETVITGYTKIDSVAKRLLSTGEWEISITLTK